MIDYTKHVGFDFETEPITDQEPLPKPVAVAIKTGENKRVYLDLNDKKDVNIFMELYYGWVRDKKSLVGHNTIFDVMIAQKYFDWFDYREIKWHCTMVLMWLVNPELKPHQLGLKSLSEKVLGDPPEDQKTLFDWLRDNQASFAHKYVNQTKNGKPLFSLDKDGKPILKNKTFKSWGAFISEAPRSLLENYALSDVDKTIDLFNYIFQSTFFANPSDRKEIWSAYERELEVQRVLYKRTIKGIRIDVESMGKDLKQMNEWLEILGKDLLDKLDITTVNSGKQLSVALVKKGYVKSWDDYVDFGDDTFKDGTKVPSTGHESLKKACDHVIIEDIKLYKRLSKFKSTYIEGWLNRANGDRLHFSFFTMLDTGRISAGTLGNIPKRKAVEVIPCSEKYKDFTPPEPRKYVLPEEGMKMITSDYSSQEVRLLAHYVGGRLAEEYNKNPKVDMHQRTVDIFRDEFDVLMERRDAKDINFGIVYGKGDWALAQALGVDVEKAVRMKEQYLSLFDGIAPFEWQVKNQLKNGKAVHTISRRKFFKRVALYIYINRIIQGSASDQLKAAMVKYDNHPDRTGELYFPLHDEVVFLVFPKYLDDEIKIIIECMEDCGIPLDVPFKVDLEVKERNYAE